MPAATRAEGPLDFNRNGFKPPKLLEAVPENHPVQNRAFSNLYGILVWVCTILAVVYLTWTAYDSTPKPAPIIPVQQPFGVPFTVVGFLRRAFTTGD